MILKTVELNNALKALGGVISPKSVIPIVENVLFRKETDNSISLHGTNLDTYICMKIIAEKPETVLLPFTLLFKTTQSVNSEYVEINGGQIKAGNSVFNMQPIPFEDFPSIPSLDGGYRLEISRTHLQSAIQAVVPFVASDDLRPVMSGINIIVNDRRMRVYGSDSHVIVRVNIPVNLDESFSATINKTFAKMIQFFNEDIELIVTNKQVCMRDGETTLFSRRIEGSMPDFDSVFPNINNTCVVKGLADSMLKSFNLAGIYANKNSNLLKVSVNDSMLIESQDLDFSVSSSVKHQCEVEGNAVVGLSSQKIIPVLQVLKTLPVELYIGEPSKAVYFKSSLCDGLIMPMLIS